MTPRDDKSTTRPRSTPPRRPGRTFATSRQPHMVSAARTFAVIGAISAMTGVWLLAADYNGWSFLVIAAIYVVMVVAFEVSWRREARLLARGTLTFGEVLATGHTVTVAFRSALGKHIVQHYSRQAFDFHAGERVAVLFDPVKPSHAVLPDAVGVEFEEQPLADRRPLLPARRDTPQADANVVEPQPLWATLRPVNRRGQKPLGWLAITDDQLIHRRPNTETVLDLARPFSLDVTCTLLDAETAEVHVSVRQDGASIVFSTIVDQDLVGRRAPELDVVAPWLHARSFRQIWPVLAERAAAHDALDAGLLRL